MRRQRKITAINAVTATTTSSKYYIGDAIRVGILLRGSGITSGNGSFVAKGSLERLEEGNGAVDSFGYQTGGNGITVNTISRLLDNATSTTFVASKAVSANGDVMVWLDPNCLMNWLELTCTRTTDGTYSAFIIVETDNEAPIR